MQVFVIGATGYIGGVLAEWLLKAGHSVIGLARSDQAAAKLHRQGMTPYRGSLDEPLALLPVLPRVEAVVHAAYKYDSTEDVQQEIASGRSHITDILAALAGSGKLFVFTSGTGVLRDTGDVIYDESTPLAPSDLPVTIARRAIEQEVLAASSKGINSIVLRPPVVYGQGGSLLIPRGLIRHAQQAGESIYIEGTGGNKWSTVHVDDLAELYLLAMKLAQPGSLWHTTAESGITTLAIAEAVSRLVGLGGQTRAVTLAQARTAFGDWADFWTLNNQSSGAKAQSELGWRPSRVPMLEDIEHGSYRC